MVVCWLVLLVVNCFVVYRYLLFVARSLLWVVACWWLVIRCSLVSLLVVCLWFVGWWLVFCCFVVLLFWCVVVCCLLFGVRFLLYFWVLCVVWWVVEFVSCGLWSVLLICCVLFVDCYSAYIVLCMSVFIFFIVCRLLCGVPCLCLVVCCWLLVVR